MVVVVNPWVEHPGPDLLWDPRQLGRVNGWNALIRPGLRWVAGPTAADAEDQLAAGREVVADGGELDRGEQGIVRASCQEVVRGDRGDCASWVEKLMPGRDFRGGAGVGLGEYFSCCGQPPEQILGCAVRQVQVLGAADPLRDQFETSPAPSSPGARPGRRSSPANANFARRPCRQAPPADPDRR